MTSRQRQKTGALVAGKQNYINHIALVLDASYSMQHLARKVVKVTDDLVAFLAKKSKEDNEETRITVYSFADEVECHIWDMDVFRLPSMSGLYQLKGSTALADAIHLTIDDFATVPEKYGDHDFMAYVLTDGQENVSKGKSGHRRAFGRTPITILQEEMSKRFASLPENVTMLALAPDDRAAQEMYGFGFEKGNVALWDASTEAGLEQAVERIKTAHSSYVATRTATGVRGTKSAFVVGGDVNAKAIKAANLKPVPTKDRKITVVVKTDDSFEKVVKPVTQSRPKPEMGWFVKIEDYVKRINKGVYPLGDAFYELVKSETIQGDKEIAVVEVDTNKVYVGDGARQLLGLSESKARVKPDLNPDYKIYVQSNSLNRHLPHGSSVLLLNR
jgi:hypothetical protein